MKQRLAIVKIIIGYAFNALWQADSLKFVNLRPQLEGIVPTMFPFTFPLSAEPAIDSPVKCVKSEISSGKRPSRPLKLKNIPVTRPSLSQSIPYQEHLSILVRSQLLFHPVVFVMKSKVKRPNMSKSRRSLSHANANDCGEAGSFNEDTDSGEWNATHWLKFIALVGEAVGTKVVGRAVSFEGESVGPAVVGALVGDALGSLVVG